tara:strand:+ start:1440 stop:1613 length:174 start_codon:yes stop_codon:yes gene_type:complete
MNWIINNKLDETIDCPDCDGQGYSSWEHTRAFNFSGITFNDCQECEGLGTIIKEDIE